MNELRDSLTQHMSGRIWLLLVVVAAALVISACQPIQAPEGMSESMPAADDADTSGMLPEGNADAGKMVFSSAIGCGCHFNRDLGALAGGNTFEGDFGSVSSVNLTPDEATGIGGMSDDQLADAIRFGVGSDGRNLFIMPRYAVMADQDVADLIAYLRSLEPVENEIPVRDLAFEVQPFEVTEDPPAVAPTEPIERGRYLATLARCSGCHTPTNEDGSRNMEMLLAGAPFRDTVAPNLTPDEATGLGLWTDEELVEFLATGIYSDGSEAASAMKGTVDGGIGQLTDEDRQAIVAFLRSLPAIENLPATPQ